MIPSPYIKLRKKDKLLIKHTHKSSCNELSLKAGSLLWGNHVYEVIMMYVLLYNSMLWLANTSQKWI